MGGRAGRAERQGSGEPQRVAQLGEGGGGGGGGLRFPARAGRGPDSTVLHPKGRRRYLRQAREAGYDPGVRPELQRARAFGVEPGRRVGNDRSEQRGAPGHQRQVHHVRWGVQHGGVPLRDAWADPVIPLHPVQVPHLPAKPGGRNKLGVLLYGDLSAQPQAKDQAPSDEPRQERHRTHHRGGPRVGFGRDR